MRISRITGALAAAVLTLGTAGAALASHTWGSYHWARTTPSFTLTLGDNLTAQWDPILATSVSDWNASSVLDLMVAPGTTSPKTCKPKAGRVELCNAKYGRNGWLGIASIWANGEHITQGTVKMNDTYFSTAQYNTVAWRNLVLCQEIGHTFGLDHQDEAFANANLGTCMDYTNDPGPNQHPNAHDYEMLESIYAHLDGSTTVGQAVAPSANMNDPREWGTEVRTSKDGRASLFVRDFGNGNKAITHVFWAEERNGRNDHHEE